VIIREKAKITVSLKQGYAARRAHIMVLETRFGFGHVFVVGEDKSCKGRTVEVD